jgi:hypothetical protein
MALSSPGAALASSNYTGGMRFLPAILIVALGCSQPPQLRLVDIGSDEFLNPMPFGLKLDRSGPAILIDGIDVECRTVVVLSPESDAKLPNVPMLVGLTAKGRETLREGETIAIAGRTEVWGIVGWELPDDAPPLLGLFEAKFTLKRHDVDVFTTPPYAFAMQSREGVFEAIVAEAQEDTDDARAILKVIERMEGTRSPCLEELRIRLTVALPPAA